MRCILSIRRVSDIGGTGTDAGFIYENTTKTKSTNEKQATTQIIAS